MSSTDHLSYPWDTWCKRARELGVADDLAQLARDVMRDHAQHGREASWIGGDHALLLDLCLQAPITARYQCVEALTWWNSAEDGGIAAFADLAKMLGSFDAAQAALDDEAVVAQRLQDAAAQDRHN